MSDRSNAKRVTLLIIIVVIALAIVFALSFLLFGGNDDTEITLPTPSSAASAQPEPEPSPEENILSIDPKNVKSVVGTLSRPASYRRKLEISVISGENVKLSTAEIWVREGMKYIELSETASVKHILILDSSVSIWYDGDDSIYSYSRNDYFSDDDLLGIPTYEYVLSLDEDSILAADYVTDSQSGSAGQLYVEFMDGQYNERYWVSLETGLLTEARSLYGGSLSDGGYSGGEVVYSMTETEMEQLPATADEFADKFTPPEP